MSAGVMSALRLSLVTALCLLSACASAPTGQSGAQPQPALHDEWFAARDSLPVMIQEKDIYRLSPELETAINTALAHNTDPSERMRFLINTVFGPEFKDFDYVSGATSTVAQTYRQRGGNCISLSIMTMVMAEALGFKPQLQEVKVPLMWERRGTTDFVNRHVNVLVRRPVNMTINALDFSRDVVLDFEPHNVSSIRAERMLNRAQVSAVFFNNLGAEAFASRQFDVAYHYYKEALNFDPSFGSIWINLGQLYSRIHQPEAAEHALRFAVQLAPENYVAVSTLHKQLRREQRHAEAAALEKTMEKLREHDPYFLYSRAMDAKQKQEYRLAAKDLEKAISVADGFETIHRELADIYGKLGKRNQAEEQIKLAESIKLSSSTIVTPENQHD